MQTNKAGSRSELAIVIVFAALLVLPALALALGGNRDNGEFIAANERRTAAAMPPQTELMTRTGTYTRALERVIADWFPLRNGLIQAYDWGKFVVLGDSSSEQVMRGRWLYLNEPAARAYVTGEFHWTDADIDYVVNIYRARAEFCRSRGARYVAMFAPDKSTIYPENLPAGVTLKHPTMLERLIPRMRAAGIEIVDAAPALIAAKHESELYSFGDTHWNAHGAYVAYRELAAALHVTPIPQTALQDQTVSGPGDLLLMSGVGHIVMDRKSEYAFRARALRVETPQYAEAGVPAQQPYATVIDDPSLPTAVMFGDSFGFALRPFVSENFRRVVHVQYTVQPFNEHIVATEHPAVVIQELVERNLANLGLEQ
ncbi:MAG: alginate O-acetyltransferase complex protein AlgJ [Candidatus Eremiobacteraeota bacterium]|jgi:hypothetical protein|nr:alginate O-acetyltransferase complex protein AlgJ [Candidatus Eremiobacteraeota bacterium]MEA2718870.1 alginate O-acetyltransferase complex protein AlgJ [Candidatus Eremiobacteraeota bacterium]